MATGQYTRRTSGTFNVNRRALQVIMVRSSLPSRYAANNYTTKEQYIFMVVVAEVGRVYHEWTTSINR